MSEEFTQLENHMQGTNLALSAVAEVLAKMDERLTKEEEDDRIDEEEKAIQAEKADLVKAVASEVVSMIKEENPLGMDVDGSKDRKAKSSAPSHDDAQTAANPTTKIEDQQAAIQAADLEDEEDEEKALQNANDDEDNGSDEEPVDKANDDDEEEDVDKANDEADEEDDDGMKAMRKELDALRKTVAAYEANMEKAIEEESVGRLRKMGFREENGLQRPALLNNEALGTDGTTPIVKSATSGDVVDDLTNLSYKQLRDLQHKIDSGDTTGVPRELLGN